MESRRLLLLFCLPYLAVSQVPGDVRLTGYRESSLAGRLEIYWNGGWGTICGDSKFDFHAARVACRQLGLGHVISYQLSPKLRFGSGSGPIHLKEVLCHGNESHILRCRYRGLDENVTGCQHEQDVAVACSNVITPYSGEVHLSGGNHPSSGRVELHLHRRWLPVCSLGFGQEDAETVCRQLGYTEAVWSTVSSDGPFWQLSTPCVDTQPCLTNCIPGESTVATETPCPAGNAVEVHCSYDPNLAADRSSGSVSLCTHTPAPTENGTVQLVDPGGSSGRVEIYFDEEWGTICDVEFSYPEADVVCKELGYPAALMFHVNSKLGPGSGSIYTVSCSGLENQLMECNPSSVAPSLIHCDHGDDVGVKCSSVTPPYGSLKLVGSAGSAGGLVMFNEHLFEPICDVGFGTEEADVACRQMGYPGVEKVWKNSYYGPMEYSDGYHRPFPQSFACTGEEDHLLACQRRGVGSGGECGTERRGMDEVGIQCSTEPPFDSGSLRLVDGGSSDRGRLEVEINGQWGTVCGAGFDQLSAHVACKQLEYSTATAFNTGGYGLVSLPIHLHSVGCTGMEERLLDCPHTVADSQNACSHEMDVSIECSDDLPFQHGDLRLTDGNDTSGRLEIALYGTWITVCGSLFPASAANVVCKQLGFGYSTDYCTDACFGPGNGSLLFSEWRCSGREGSLLECPYEVHNSAFCDHSIDVGIFCGSMPPTPSSSTVQGGGGPSDTPQSPVVTTSPTTSNDLTETTILLHIPDLYFYVGVGVIGLIVVVLIVAFTVCCVSACGKRNKRRRTWESSDGPTSSLSPPPAVTPVRIRSRLPRGEGAHTMDAFELPAKNGAEDFDDPAVTVETEIVTSSAVTSLPSPPKYDELEFYPPVNVGVRRNHNEL